jgi:hypothetical protein
LVKVIFINKMANPNQKIQYTKVSIMTKSYRLSVNKIFMYTACFQRFYYLLSQAFYCFNDAEAEKKNKSIFYLIS